MDTPLSALLSSLRLELAHPIFCFPDVAKMICLSYTMFFWWGGVPLGRQHLKVRRQHFFSLNVRSRILAYSGKHQSLAFVVQEEEHGDQSRAGEGDRPGFK